MRADEVLCGVVLAWPFLAAAYGAATGSPRHPLSASDPAEEQPAVMGVVSNPVVRVALAAAGCVVTVFALLFTLVGGASQPGSVPGTVLFGCFLLHLGLLAECLALPDGREKFVNRIEQGLPFLSVGLACLALMIGTDAVAFPVLLVGWVLIAFCRGRRRGNAGEGWDVLRFGAVGGMLALAGALHPVASSAAVLTGFGFIVLGGLFPVSPFVGSGAAIRPRDRVTDAVVRQGYAVPIAVLRLCAAALLMAGQRTLDGGGTLTSGVVVDLSPLFLELGLAGLVTVAVCSLVFGTARVGAVNSPGGALVFAQGCLGLGAIAVAQGDRPAVFMALLGPLLGLPWRLVDRTAGDRLRSGVAGWLQSYAGALFMLPAFVAVLLLGAALAARSGVLVALLMVAVLPAFRRCGTRVRTAGHPLPMRDGR